MALKAWRALGAKGRPRSPGRAAACAALVAASSLLQPHEAVAGDVAACVEAYDAAQVLRRDGSLTAAREKLVVCGQSHCPQVVQTACATWLDEVEHSIPTIVFHALGPDGQDAVAVSVSMDGKPLLDALDGRAVRVDPGVHVLRFEMEGEPPVEMRVVIQEGVKNRLIEVQIGEKPEPVPLAPPAPSVSTQPRPVEPPPRLAPRTDDDGPPTLAYVLGGAGVVGIGAFTALALSFDGQYEDLQACSPGCPQDDVDSAASTRRWALASGAFGVAALGTAAALWLGSGSAKGETEQAPTSGVGIAVVPEGVVGGWSARF